MRSQSRHSKLLRLLWVAATVCGLLLQPVLAALGDLHAIEHATAVGSDHGHDHGHDHDHPPAAPSGDDTHQEASGLHGLLHAHAGMSAAALLDLPFFNGNCPRGSGPLLVMADSGPAALYPSSPFRPPIA